MSDTKNNKKTNIVSKLSDEEKIFSEVSWKLVETYFKDKRRLVQHQINSFENFIEKSIPKIIENIGNINLGSPIA